MPSTDASLDDLRERFLLCIESSCDGVWDWNLKTDHVWYSHSFRSTLGYDTDQWPESLEAFKSHLHPDDEHAVWPIVESHLAGKSELDIEFRLRCGDGEYRWFRSRGGVRRDEHGKPIRLAGAIHSIQRQKESERDVRQLAERLSAEAAERQAAEALYFDLYDQSPDLYVSVDLSTATISRCNQTILDRLGRRQDELIGQPIISIYHPDCLEKVRDTFEQFRTTGVVSNAELILVDGDENPIPVILNASPIRDANGKVVASRSVLRDITELADARQTLQSVNRELENRVLVRTRELERQNKDLNHFVHIASHDLKAPLRGVKMVAGWLQEDCGDVLPEDSKGHLQSLCSRIDRMEGLLNSILEYSRAGRSKNVPQKVDLNDLIAKVIEPLQLPSGFQIHVPGGMPTLQTDPQLLHRVLQNLIENAIKHRSRDDGNIDISWQPTPVLQGNHMVQISVADDGPGIEPKYRQRIFEMFQTLQPRDEVEGSGIGLAVVKRLVESVDGEISVTESPSGGAKFQFTWEGLQ